MVRQNSRYRVNLYHLNGFYIQLWYDVKRNRIERIAATESASVMNPYLKQIQLNDLQLN